MSQPRKSLSAGQTLVNLGLLFMGVVTALECPPSPNVHATMQNYLDGKKVSPKDISDALTWCEENTHPQCKPIVALAWYDACIQGHEFFGETKKMSGEQMAGQIAVALEGIGTGTMVYEPAGYLGQSEQSHHDIREVKDLIKRQLLLIPASQRDAVMAGIIDDVRMIMGNSPMGRHAGMRQVTKPSANALGNAPAEAQQFYNYFMDGSPKDAVASILKSLLPDEIRRVKR